MMAKTQEWLIPEQEVHTLLTGVVSTELTERITGIVAQLQQQLDHARAEAETAKGEAERLQQWVHDCQASMYINCVYCGHRYGPDDEVPATMADVLKEHIEQCPKHPMSALRRELNEAQTDNELLLSGKVEAETQRDELAAALRDTAHREAADHELCWCINIPVGGVHELECRQARKALAKAQGGEATRQPSRSPFPHKEYT